MFVGERYLAHDLPWVLERLGNPALLAEEPAGDPPWIALPEHGVVTSANTVHHLHHLLRYEQVCRWRRPTSSWSGGAGHGNLARLVDRLHPRSPTCVLIDTPVFSALQWLHLSLSWARIVWPCTPSPGRRWSLGG